MKPWFKDLLLALTMSVALVASAPGASQVRAQTEQVRGHEPQVTITGVANETVAGQPPAVGHVLRAEATAVDPDQDTIDTIEYRWLRGGTEVGTAQTYTATAADVGQTLTIEVTATTDAATTDPASGQARTTVTVGANTAPTANPTISGTPAVGAVLTGSVGYADAEGDAEGTHSYQWYRADDAAGANRTPISGATAATYTVVSADQGKYLVFEVIPKAATGTPDIGVATNVVSASEVVGTAPTATDLNVSTGSSWGNTVTGNYQYADADGDPQGASTFKWYSADNSAGTLNRTLIASATGRNFGWQDGSVAGKYLVFEVTPVSSTGTPNEGSPASAVTSREIPYHVFGRWKGITAPVVVANRTGNAPTNLEVWVYLSAGPGSGSSVCAQTLVAPDGAQYPLRPVQSGAGAILVTSVNASGSPANGDWFVLFPTGCGWSNVLEITQVRLHF